MALDWRTTKQQIHLFIRIPKPTQVFNHPPTCLPVGNSSIQVMLLPIMIDAESFKGQISTGSKLGFDWTWYENRRFHRHLGRAVLDHAEFNRDDTSHFDSATEGDLPVALREMQVSYREFGSLDVHGEVDFASTAEVFDITVSTIFRSALYIVLVTTC